MDLFDWLSIIQKLKDEELIQEKIGEKIGWSRRKVSDYNQIIEKFGALFLNLCKQHQKGRAPNDGALATFDFTEGWFRTSGLYDLQEEIGKKVGLHQTSISKIVNNANFSKIHID